MYCDKCGKEVLDGQVCDCQNNASQGEKAIATNNQPKKVGSKIWMGILSIIGAVITILGVIYSVVFLLALALSSIGNNPAPHLEVLMLVCFGIAIAGGLVSLIFGALSIVHFVKCKKAGYRKPVATLVLAIIGITISVVGTIVLFASGL